MGGGGGAGQAGAGGSASAGGQDAGHVPGACGGLRSGSVGSRSHPPGTRAIPRSWQLPIWNRRVRCRPFEVTPFTLGPATWGFGNRPTAIHMGPCQRRNQWEDAGYGPAVDIRHRSGRPTRALYEQRLRRDVEWCVQVHRWRCELAGNIASPRTRRCRVSSTTTSSARSSWTRWTTSICSLHGTRCVKRLTTRSASARARTRARRWKLVNGERCGPAAKDSRRTS